MNFSNEGFGNGQVRPNQAGDGQGPSQNDHPDELSEDDLELELFTDGTKKPVREGQPMGGHNFSKNNVTSSANDKNNPSRYAGDSNPFFKPTEPLEEHPENNNFKVPDQEGRPDYDKARPDAFRSSGEPKPEKVERGDGENDRPHEGDDQYQEGTVDNDEPNIPGPRELPDQQKVGEDVDENEREHIET